MTNGLRLPQHPFGANGIEHHPGGLASGTESRNTTQDRGQRHKRRTFTRWQALRTPESGCDWPHTSVARATNSMIDLSDPCNRTAQLNACHSYSLLGLNDAPTQVSPPSLLISTMEIGSADQAHPLTTAMSPHVDPRLVQPSLRWEQSPRPACEHESCFDGISSLYQTVVKGLVARPGCTVRWHSHFVMLVPNHPGTTNRTGPPLSFRSGSPFMA